MYNIFYQTAHSLVLHLIHTVGHAGAVAKAQAAAAVLSLVSVRAAVQLQQPGAQGVHQGELQQLPRHLGTATQLRLIHIINKQKNNEQRNSSDPIRWAVQNTTLTAAAQMLGKKNSSALSASW